VKPGNLLLTEDASGNLRVKVCDLGLLTVLQQAATLSGSARAFAVSVTPAFRAIRTAALRAAPVRRLNAA